MASSLPQETVISLEQVSKKFGPYRALRETTVSFKRGERVLIAGANGSGKSTLLRLLSGLSDPSKGVISRAGVGGTRAPIGFVSQQLMLYAHLTVAENLRIFSDLSGGSDDVHAAVERWKLAPYLNRRIKELSKAWQFRLSAARSLLGSPQLILLDEPTASFDDDAVGVLRAALDEIDLKRGAETTILLATHDFARLESFGSRTILLAAGEVIEDGEGPEARGRIIARYRSVNR